MSRITAVVPVKMNSKRLYGKNMMKINDIPLIEWTVRTLNNVEDIDTIIIYWKRAIMNINLRDSPYLRFLWHNFFADCVEVL